MSKRRGSSRTSVFAVLDPYRAHVAGMASVGNILLVLGLAALIVPTLASLARWSWSSDIGAHGPIVLATGLWLVWRDREHFRERVPQPLFPGAYVLFVLLPLYVVFRVTGTLMGEAFTLYLILLTVGYLQFGRRVLLRLWFPCVYLLFIITPPAVIVAAATRPIKTALSLATVELLSGFGLAIGSSGSYIQVDGYQLQVAAACSGINSLVGITAITLFYVYLLYGTQVRYALVLSLLLVPIAIAANFLRIVVIVLVTHWFGQEVAGVMHDTAALGMFVLALLMLFLLDSALYPLFGRLGWARG